MRYVWIAAALLGVLSAARIHAMTWPTGWTFPRYLQERNMTDLLPTISAEDMQYVTEVQAGERFYELRDRGGIAQALIPIGDAMQIQIVRTQSGGHRFDIVPIVFRTVRDTVSIRVRDGYHKQIDRHTRYPRLGFELRRLFKGTVAFRTLQPEDRIAFVYTQKERLGEPLGAPRIQGALLRTHGKTYYIFVGHDGSVYAEGKKTVEYTATEQRPFTYTTVRKIPVKTFRMPVDHPRITSRFSLRRWHPILKKYRPHFGVDFGARRGTPLHAVHDGKVIYAGWMRGYGKVVKIDHGYGFVSLYAHQSKILVKLHQYVKRGQIIGRVGSTGRSTGPHLHFGLYLHGHPVDPLHYIARKGVGKARTVTEKHTKIKKYPVTRQRRVAVKGSRVLRQRLEAAIQHETAHNYVWPASPKTTLFLHDVSESKHASRGGYHG